MNQSVPWTPEQVAEENLDQLLGGAIAEIDDYEEEEAAGGEDVDEEEDQKPQATKTSSASSSKAAAAKARQQKQAAAKKQGAVASKTRSQLKPSSSSASAATTVAVGGGGDEGSAAAAAAEPLTAGGFRGPLKAAFKHWKAKQGEGGARAVQYCGRYGAVRLEGGEVSDGSGEAEGGLPPPQGSVALLFGLLWLAD